MPRVRATDPVNQEEVDAALDGGLLRSVANCLAVLGAFSVQRPNWTLSELSRHLGLGKSTTFRLLTTLEAHGFVRRHPDTGRYGVGLRVFEIGCAAVGPTGLRQATPFHLSRLVELTGETAYCAVLDGRHVVHVEVHVTANPIRLHAAIGDRFPAHAVASGKVLLAHGPPAAVEAYIADGLAGFTARTIIDPDRLRAELADVRVRGFAVNQGEFQDEVWGAAAPVRDHRGVAIAAVAVAGPNFRLKEDLTELGGIVRAVADTFSRELGAPTD
jgi:DNA-binding IclR family transcriptional regulator